MPTDYNALRAQRLAEADEETRAVYALIGNAFDLRQMGVEASRRALSALTSGLSAGGVADSVSAETVQIPGPAGDIATRIYRPDGHKRPGVYIHTHGGGYVGCPGLDAFDGINSEYVTDWECAVVYPDFRLPPENKFPAGIEDCWATVQWVWDNADEIGVDRSRIAVGGGCTGANIAAVMALMARDAGTPEFALQVLQCPQLDTREDYQSHFEFAEGYGLTRDADLWVIEQYLSDPEQRWDWRVSPVLVPSVRGLAPALIAVGEWEVLRDEARFYANRLRDAGVAVHYIEGDNGGHGYFMMRNPLTGQLTKTAQRDLAVMTKVVRSYIGPEAAAQ